ncbi:threonine/serine exporter family protein, partial [Paramuribaculum intestinale]
RTRTPAEAYFFPALLPMIPGMYAYRAFGALAVCVLNDNPDTFGYYFYQAASNGFVCMAVLIAMVTGATLPIFIFKKISFQATR